MAPLSSVRAQSDEALPQTKDFIDDRACFTHCDADDDSSAAVLVYALASTIHSRRRFSAFAQGLAAHGALLLGQ